MGVWRWGEREIIYLSLHCHHQNDTCIKMGSDESHFNVSLIVRDKVTRQCPQTAAFEEKGERRIRTEVLLSAYQPNALPLGQTGSLSTCLSPAGSIYAQKGNETRCQTNWVYFNRSRLFPHNTKRGRSSAEQL